MKTFDALGAFLVTAGLSTLVLGITQGHGWGWGSGRTIGVFVARSRSSPASSAGRSAPPSR